MEVQGPKKVLYCEACGLPGEYCEFSPEVDTCIEWLKKHEPDRVATAEQVATMRAMSDEVRKKMKLKPVERPETAAGTADEEGVAEKKAGGGEGEAAAEPKPAPKKKRHPRVTVSRVQRSKRKFLTLVEGIDAYGVDLKEACSAFKKKFACGVSVVKGTTEIEIQGDVSYEIAEFIIDKWPQIDKKYVKFGEDSKATKR